MYQILAANSSGTVFPLLISIVCCHVLSAILPTCGMRCSALRKDVLKYPKSMQMLRRPIGEISAWSVSERPIPILALL
ncbi:hypothetical protein VKT23_009562 [Stygiomarasmius scandens]|uniref:Secreted protein n=1 Tax=Marasmiellus scandens TaxID=2682957 RepID=A0ABR1JGP1_9AGAR